jgi:hypothetical protein
MCISSRQIVAAVSLSLAACSAEPIAGPAAQSPVAGGTILTTFDRLTLARGERSSFRASVVAGDRLSSDGLTFVSRAASVARVSAVRGRAQVEAAGAGRTWILIQSSAAADSVEVIVQ